MKRIYVGALLCVILLLGLLTGCDQGVARSLGGDMTLELEPGQKLEMILCGISLDRFKMERSRKHTLSNSHPSSGCLRAP